MDEGNGVFAGGFAEVVADLRREYLEELSEQAHELLTKAEKAGNDAAALDALVRDARKLALAAKVPAETLGFALIMAVSQRMEDFLTEVRTLPPRAREDILRYAETLVDLVEGRISSDVEPRALVRTLPQKLGFVVDDIETRDVEVMLVMLHGTATRFVERELHQCGYRTSVVTTTFEALPQIVRTRPDLVVVSAVMPDLSGIDLAIAIATMPATRNIPVALITSLDPDDDYLKLLPAHVPVILKGPTFGDDLAEALDRLFII